MYLCSHFRQQGPINSPTRTFLCVFKCVMKEPKLCPPHGHCSAGFCCLLYILSAANDATSEQACFRLHHQISCHIAWVTQPRGPNEKLCRETTQQLKQHTRCFSPQLHHNGFNYSRVCSTTAAWRRTPGLIIRLSVALAGSGC